jgi:arylformamidase
MNTLFRGMDQATLDLAYNNSAAVPDAAQKLADFIRRSKLAYTQHPCHRDMSYGNRARQRFDWFATPHGANAATVMFIHGGYWQWCNKEDFAFIVAGPLAQGFNVVLAEYTLAPEARMTGIVAEIGQLLNFLASHSELGGSKAGPLPAGRKLIVAGHSAGGHLAAYYRNHPAVNGVLAVSGLFELEPIRLSNLNQALGLSTREAADFSPYLHISPGAPTHVMAGAGELPELIRQSEDYARAMRETGETPDFKLLTGHDHFSVLEELARPDGALVQALQALAARA